MNSRANELIETYKEWFMNLPHAIFKLFFPDTGLCNFCGSTGEIVCDNCSSQIQRHEGTLCEKCGRSISSGRELCHMCLKDIRPYDKGVIAFYYDGIARDMMKEYKFENTLPYSSFFADEIYEKIDTIRDEIDIITAVPMHFMKIIGKGYNPPALIAKKLAKTMDVSYQGKILKRTRYTKSMSRLKGINRMEHSRKNFDLRKNCIKNKNILIIDDVATTGATLHVCADILKENGANKVFVAAVCGDTHKN